MATSYEVQTALRDKGFASAGTACFGWYQGYAIKLSPSSGDCFRMELAVRLDQNNRELERALAGAFRQAGAHRIIGVLNQGAALELTLRFDRQTSVGAQIDEALAQAVSVLRSWRVTPADTCVVCGGAGPDSLARYKGYQPIHASCARDLVRKAEAAGEENRLNGSHLTGLVGAVLGAVVGMLPSLLTLLLLDSFFLLLFLLVPIAAAWGYRGFGGKRDRLGRAIVILLSLLSVFPMVTLSVAGEVAETFGLGFGEALSVALRFIGSGEGIAYLLRNSLIPMLFMVLGLLIAWRTVRRTSAGDIRDAKAVVAALRPKPDFQFEEGNRS